jgi:DNA-directed RNA polymerase subunit E'/Rpb7
MDQTEPIKISDEAVTLNIPTIVAAPAPEQAVEPVVESTVEPVPTTPEPAPEPAVESVSTTPDPSVESTVEPVPTTLMPIPTISNVEIPVPIDMTQQQQGKIKAKKYMTGIYSFTTLTRKIALNISEVGSNLFINITKKLQEELEGKCTIEGFIKPDTINVITVSVGRLFDCMVEYHVVFECYLCCPVEGMIIKNCLVKNITKAGIRAVISEELSPVTVFVSRDHHYDNDDFSTINEEDLITVKVVGVRFELNDTSISVIANLQKQKNKPRIILSSK